MISKAYNRLKWRERIVRYAPVLFWLGVILAFSTGQAAMSETSRFIRPLLEFLFPEASPYTLTLYHGYIRKFAHLAEYAILGFLAARAFSRSSHAFLRSYWLVAAATLSLIVAAADETNQGFIHTRTGSAWDVALDFCGALTALLIYYFLSAKNDTKEPAAAADAV